MMVYTQIYDGNWYWIKRKGRSACCHCGAVHDEEYRIEIMPRGQHRILYKAVGNRRATAQVRRHMDVRLVPRRRKK